MTWSINETFLTRMYLYYIETTDYGASKIIYLLEFIFVFIRFYFVVTNTMYKEVGT